MNPSIHSVTILLILMLGWGVLGIALAALARFRNNKTGTGRRILLDGFSGVIISVALLLLLRTGLLGPFPVLIVLALVMGPTAFLIIKSGPKDVTSPPPWGVTRQRGRKRFVLMHVLVFGGGGVWTVLFILVLDWSLWYLSLIVLLVGVIFGYLQGSRVWQQKENEYLKSGDNLNPT
jgi:hypothetical protein